MRVGSLNFKCSLCILFVSAILSQRASAFSSAGFGRSSLAQSSSFHGNRVGGIGQNSRLSASKGVVRYAVFDNQRELGEFDPFSSQYDGDWGDMSDRGRALITTMDRKNGGEGIAGNLAPMAALTIVNMAIADEASAAGGSVVSQGMYNPDNFKPVCSASDGFYRFLQGATKAVVGDDQFVEYGPLIAGGLLRVRLELCVVESFFNEAVGPFIKQNGLSWILPLHETVETFIAGTIFALATTFILVGSTKLISVIALYADVFIGGPCRLFGGFFFDRALGKPVTLDVGIGPWKKRLVGPPDQDGNTSEGGGEVDGNLSNMNPAQIPVVAASGAVKYLGEGSKIIREGIEALDLFVGRYLVILATGYILLKFVHFKIFPDFPPF